MDNTQIYMHQQIYSMNYWELVQMLMKQITPEIRKCILDRLTEMNNELIAANKAALLKAMTPPIQNAYKNQNPISEKLGATSRFSESINSDKNSDSEIDIDDIIDDVQKKPDELDNKLNRIKYLYDKVVTEKRKRRAMREQRI